MDALQLTQELIAFESTSNLSNVDICDFLQRTLQTLGFGTERVDFEDESGVPKANVIGKKGPGTGGLAYFGHTDVVPADDWCSDDHGPFSPRVKEDKLFGRGACDMKGSIACMLAAAALADDRQLRQPLYITCTADEEVGYGGARQVARQSKLYREMVQGGSRGIVGEPTLLEVVYAHKGTYGFRAISRGRAAHSATREGINANLAMIPFLQEMKRIYDQSETDLKWQNNQFDPPTISWNIGINDFTTAVNITPPQSICTVYFRPMPHQDTEALLQRVRDAAASGGLEFELMRRCDPLYVDPASEMVQETLAVAGKNTPRTVCYGTDGGVFRDMKHLVVLGPGSIDQAHTNDEWISLDQLQRGTDLYSKLIQHWCCR